MSMPGYWRILESGLSKFLRFSEHLRIIVIDQSQKRIQFLPKWCKFEGQAPPPFLVTWPKDFWSWEHVRSYSKVAAGPKVRSSRYRQQIAIGPLNLKEWAIPSNSLSERELEIALWVELKGQSARISAVILKSSVLKTVILIVSHVWETWRI